MKNNLTKTTLFAIISPVFCCCLIMANILAGKVFNLTSTITLTAGVLTFPITYIVNDLLTEVYGYEKAKSVIFTGFGINIFAVIIYTIAVALPYPDYVADVGQAFAIVLSQTPRILIASLLSYLAGSLLNAKVMALLKKKDGESRLSVRCVLSTLVGEGIDSIVFVFIVFLGVMTLKDMLIMIVAQVLFKTIYEIVIYPVTRIIIGKVKALPEG